jgi:hypothetical protein
MALGTGLGKTALSIAAMQKFKRDGYLEDSRYNGRYLFVCPAKLIGNAENAALKFLDDANATDLLDRLDSVSYKDFARYSKNQKMPPSLKKKRGEDESPWDVSKYVAIFFDEAQKLKKLTTADSKAAMNLNHPRKILLTASPMEKEPMEAYILASIANNKNLNQRRGGKLTDEAKEARKSMRNFKKRFTNTVGGRIVGVKNDPLVKRDLDTWVKRNVYYADKTDVEEFKLPTLNSDTQVVVMEPEVEQVYRVLSNHCSRIMEGLVIKLRDKGLLNRRGKPDPRAVDPEVEKAFSARFAPVLALFNGLSNYPDETMMDISAMLRGEKKYPKALEPVLQILRAAFTPAQLEDVASRVSNPKMEAAVLQIEGQMTEKPGSRSLLFSDDPKMVMTSAKKLSQEIPGLHLAGLGNSIHVFENGAEKTEYKIRVPDNIVGEIMNERLYRQVSADPYVTFKLPFKKKAYRKYSVIPADPYNNREFPADSWAKFILDELVKNNADFKTITLQGRDKRGSVFSQGQNLQTFNNVVQLDRDTWNAEEMQQRVARSWRQGQKEEVTETTIDVTYNEPAGEFDRTFDEIQKYLQQLEGDLFNRIIKDAQGVQLGTEWFEMDQKTSKFHTIEKQNMALAASPYMNLSYSTR